MPLIDNFITGVTPSYRTSPDAVNMTFFTDLSPLGSLISSGQGKSTKQGKASSGKPPDALYGQYIGTEQMKNKLDREIDQLQQKINTVWQEETKKGDIQKATLKVQPLVEQFKQYVNTRQTEIEANEILNKENFKLKDSYDNDGTYDQSLYAQKDGMFVGYNNDKNPTLILSNNFNDFKGKKPLTIAQTLLHQQYKLQPGESILIPDKIDMKKGIENINTEFEKLREVYQSSDNKLWLNSKGQLKRTTDGNGNLLAFSEEKEYKTNAYAVNNFIKNITSFLGTKETQALRQEFAYDVNNNGFGVFVDEYKKDKDNNFIVDKNNNPIVKSQKLVDPKSLDSDVAFNWWLKNKLDKQKGSRVNTPINKYEQNIQNLPNGSGDGNGIKKDPKTYAIELATKSNNLDWRTSIESLPEPQRNEINNKLAQIKKDAIIAYYKGIGIQYPSTMDITKLENNLPSEVIIKINEQMKMSIPKEILDKSNLLVNNREAINGTTPLSPKTSWWYNVTGKGTNNTIYVNQETAKGYRPDYANDFIGISDKKIINPKTTEEKIYSDYVTKRVGKFELKKVNGEWIYLVPKLKIKELSQGYNSNNGTQGIDMPIKPSELNSFYALTVQTVPINTEAANKWSTFQRGDKWAPETTNAYASGMTPIPKSVTLYTAEIPSAVVGLPDSRGEKEVFGKGWFYVTEDDLKKIKGFLRDENNVNGKQVSYDSNEAMEKDLVRKVNQKYLDGIYKKAKGLTSTGTKDEFWTKVQAGEIKYMIRANVGLQQTLLSQGLLDNDKVNIPEVKNTNDVSDSFIFNPITNVKK